MIINLTLLALTMSYIKYPSAWALLTCNKNYYNYIYIIIHMWNFGNFQVND